MTTQFSRLDKVYRRLLLSKFFSQGWGDPDSMKRIFKFRKIISNRNACHGLVSIDHPIIIDRKIEETNHYILFEGHFHSPLVDYLPDLVPKESRTAYFQFIMPTKWKYEESKSVRPICVHLAGTGDHGFWRRRNFMAKPLIYDFNIGSIILENPFYGMRKPKNQFRSQLNNVLDIFIMGGCLILESLALFRWAKRMGFNLICITGISMGGHNASLAATIWNEPLAVVPCLSWTTASSVFTEGVMSRSIKWNVLQSQYENHFQYFFHKDFQELIYTPEKYFDDNLLNLKKNNVAKNCFSICQLSKFNSNLPFDLSSKKFNEDNLIFENKNQIFNEDLINERNAAYFMRIIMDECTHLANFPSLIDPTMAVIIQAECDAYVPRNGVIPLTELWPGSNIRYLKGGHISAILFEHNEFRRAIADSLNMVSEKYFGFNLYEHLHLR